MKKLFNKSDNELVGHYIPYVITKNTGNLAEKAVHPTQFMRSQSEENKFLIDIEWYKTNQLINPLERLLNPIEGFSIDMVNRIFGVEKREA